MAIIPPIVPRKIFIGGYTKSGTTFIGRAFGLFNGVYAKGELDYFRLFSKGMGDMARAYNGNIAVVNKEVYDGQGSLEPLSPNSFRALHDKTFNHIFFAGQPVPDDCVTIVEKSPRNIFWLEQITLIFPDAVNICVYREPKAVFRSLMRHMADHRDPKFNDPDFAERANMLNGFCPRWEEYVSIIEKNQQSLKVVQYQNAADDNQAFLDYVEKDILHHSPGLRAPVKTLSKEHYLKSLPKDTRAKSLVQTGSPKIKLADNETATLEQLCRAPNVSFDF